MALILLLVLTPIWLIWAFIELFTGEIVKANAQPSQNIQNVNVSYVVEGSHDSRVPLVTSGAASPLPHESFGLGKVIDIESVEGEVVQDTKECPYCAEKIKLIAVYYFKLLLSRLS